MFIKLLITFHFPANKNSLTAKIFVSNICLLKSKVEGNTEMAIQYYDETLKLNSNFTEAYINRGIALMGKENYIRALSDFIQAEKLQPDNYLIYYNRGNLFGKLKKYDEAIKEFSISINLNINYAPAYYGRGIAECYNNTKELGCTDFQKALNLGFQQADVAYKYFCH